MKKKNLVPVALVILMMIFFAGQSMQAAQLTQTPTSANLQKVIIPATILNAEQEGITLWHDYGAFALYTINDTTLSTLSTNQRDHITFVDDRILIDAYPFDTQKDSLDIPQEWRYPVNDEATLQLIQFVGPIKDEWLKQVEAAGAQPIHYIANNAYLVWANKSARSSLAEMAMENDFLQFSGTYEPFFKLGTTLRDRDLTNNDLVPVTIQMLRHNGRSTTEALIKGMIVESVSNWDPILDYQNLTAVVHASDIPTIAQQPDVYWIGERLERELTDEIQGQILAGNFNGDQSGPSGTGYLTWLDSFGFSQNPADYPIVDITDDGIGNGTTASGDPTLHLFGNTSNATRLAYVDNCTSEANGEGLDGHGHINTSIVGGYDSQTGFPFQDPNGYLRGVGVSPYGQIAGTRIFDAVGYDISGCGGTDIGVIKSSQDRGAQISTNSWGCRLCAGSYDESSQAYDVGVRDADLTEAGNQELMFIFAAGNSGSGSGTIGTPGNGKNMLTVGASESQRPSDEDGNWTDGCAIGPTGADDAMDIIGFSSRGPAPGGRVKPEVIAPGTHIQGTASTSSSYTGSGVCDQYRPSGQTTFAASSGTSHSTPAVAGVSSLVYYWLQNNQPVADAGASYTPSPAVVKAYVMNHPTYLTGVSANDTLPSNNQGYGMPNMGVMFDNTPKYIVDQSVLFDQTGETWTWEGIVVDPSKPVRIMMVYTDKAGALGTSPQVNDLNLAATINNVAYYGNNFTGQWSNTNTALDSLNNYEAIFLPTGTSGAMQITITAFNVADDGVPNVGDGTDQDFALVCYNCTQNADFSLMAQPSSLDICTPDNAVYDVYVGSVLGYADAVTLSASGHPAGTTAVFGTNSSTAPYTTTLTIGNTGSVPYNDYPIAVTGMGPTSTYTSTINLSVYTAVPVAPTNLSPTDSAVDVSLAPIFSWDGVNQNQGYYLEVATDDAFNTIVYSTTVQGTSHVMSGMSLDPETTYHWRVRSTNVCGDGTYASGSFTTVLLYCSFPNAPISNNSTTTDTLTLSRDDVLSDINVYVQLSHTFIGDLDITLTNEGTGKSVVLLPASFSCSGDDMDVIFDDESANPISCGGSIPALSGDVQPSEPLLMFDYVNLAGNWRLDVHDGASGVQGTLQQWCLEPEFTNTVATIVGTVTDANDGTPVEGALVTVDNDYTTLTDANGDYARDAASGTYTVTAEQTNYVTGIATDVVLADAVATTVDFALTAGLLNSSADNFAATLELSNSASSLWTLENIGTADLDFNIRIKNNGFEPTINSIMAGEDILIVNEDSSATAAMSTALDNLGHTYAAVTSSEFTSMSVADLLSYRAVLYTGTISSGAEETQVMAYLDAGGHFLVADNDLGFYLNGSTLYNTYLQATYVSNTGSNGLLTGADIMVGLNPDISAAPSPDDFTVGVEGVEIFKAPSGNSAGVRVERNGYQAIYLAWDYQYTDTTASTDILDKALRWLAFPFWLSTDIDSGTLTLTNTQDITVTMDASLVDLAGEYYADLVVSNNTPYGDTVIPVTMTVSCAACGTLMGDITDIFNSDPVTATILITNTSGFKYTFDDVPSYGIQLPTDTYYLTVTADNYFPETAVASVTTGGTTVEDVALTRIFANLYYSPDAIEEYLEFGDIVTNTVTVTNTGTIALDFTVRLDNLLTPIAINSLKITPLGNNLATKLPASPVTAVSQETVDALIKTDAARAAGNELTDFRWAAANNVLYDNGPLVNCAGCGSGGADESVLQNVSLGLRLLGFGHQVSAGNRIADDFVIENGTWTIDTITFFAYQTNAGIPSTITAVNLQIWDGPPNDSNSNVIFGDTVTNRMVSTDWSNIYRVNETTSGNTQRAIMANVVDVSGLVLSPGTYWLDWQTDGSLSSGPWAPPITINGETTTGNALQYVSAWGAVLDSGTATQQGFPFIIEGIAESWVEAVPNSGSIPPNSTATFDVAFDATSLYQVGTYAADLIFEGNQENTAPAMPLTMHVTCPTCGILDGNIYDLYTSDSLTANANLTDGSGFDKTTTNDNYQFAVPPGVYTLTISADGYYSETMTVTAVESTTTTNDFDLRYIAPRITVEPTAFAAELVLGDMTTRTLDIMNTGTFSTPFEIDVVNTTLSWLTTDPITGTIDGADGDNMVTADVIFDTATLTQTGVYTASLYVNTTDPINPQIDVPVVMTVTLPNPAIMLDVTVSTANECGTANSLVVEAGTMVYYCYTVTNTGNMMLDYHVITDTVFGAMDAFYDDLMPAASQSRIYTQTVTADALSTVRWTAMYEYMGIETMAEDSATVEVIDRIYLPIIKR